MCGTERTIYPDVFFVLSTDKLVDINNISHIRLSTERFSIVSTSLVPNIPNDCQGLLMEHISSDGSQRQLFTIIVQK